MKKKKIYNIFYILLLEQNITRKRQVDKNATKLVELDAGNNDSGEWKIEAICNSAVYTRESADHLPKFYYLVS